MHHTRRQFMKGAAALAAAAAGGTALSSCSSGGETSNEFSILQYEDPTQAQGQGWKLAVQIFKKKHPELTVKFQTTSFDAVRKNAKLMLAGNDVPDLMEFNKGNADGGQLAAQGLMANLTPQVKKYGWDKKVTGAMQSLALYNSLGNAGSGNWYGIPNIGEYVTMYYNKELFKKAGISSEPTTMDEFIEAMKKLKAAGITPVSSSASTNNGWNQLWLWYSLVSAYADRKQINDFVFLQHPVDFSVGPWSTGTDQFQEWIEEGYLGKGLGGLNFEQAAVTFLSGKAGMYMWNNGQFVRMQDEAKFDWGFFTLPSAKMTLGSSGHLWGVPAKSAHKELAYEFIDITLGKEVQNRIGQLGGLPLAADLNKITDPVTKAYTKRFYETIDDDSLSFYPDYPIIGFLDFLATHMQKMSSGSETSKEFRQKLQKFYDTGRKEALVP